MTTYTAGEIADASRLVDEMRSGRRPSPAELDRAEVVLRGAYVQKIKREAAVAAIAGPRRTVRDDAPSLESIQKAHGVASAWDLNPSEAREQAESDRTLGLLRTLEAQRTADLLADSGAESRGDDVPDLETIDREHRADDLAELERLASAPEEDEDEDAALLREVNRLNQ